MGGSARPGNLRRLERARIPARHEGIAAAARLAAAARCSRCALRVAPPMDRLGWRASRLRHARRPGCGGCRCDGFGAWRCELAAPWLQRYLGIAAAEGGGDGG